MVMKIQFTPDFCIFLAKIFDMQLGPISVYIIGGIELKLLGLGIQGIIRLKMPFGCQERRQVAQEMENAPPVLP